MSNGDRAAFLQTRGFPANETDYWQIYRYRLSLQHFAVWPALVVSRMWFREASKISGQSIFGDARRGCPLSTAAFFSAPYGKPQHNRRLFRQ